MMTEPLLRDQQWLETRFHQLWSIFFPDVEKKEVSIRWKGRWKNKFGHISRRNGKSEIVMNRHFQDLRVPEDIIKLTIAHEIIHYMHGFHSHLPRQHAHPHKGGIVDKELIKRGFTYAITKEKEWIRKDWPTLHKELSSRRQITQPQQQPLTFWSWLKK